MGGKTAEAIVHYINKKSGDPSTVITCADVLEEKASAKLNMIFFGAHEGEAFETFNKVAKNPHAEAFSFFHTDAECAEAYGVVAPGVAILRTFDEPKVAYKGELTVDGMLEFMRGSSVPTVFAFSEEYLSAVFKSKNDALFLFTEEEEGDYHAVFAEVAKELKGKILFGTSGASQGIQQKLASFVDVRKDDLPLLVILQPPKDAQAKDTLQRYVFPGNIKESLGAAEVKKFIEDFHAGNLKPTRKSEPIPYKTESGVTVVVGLSWDEIVQDETKDVLIEYYAPWCGHCKKLEPIWDDLGEHVRTIGDLVIAKMDATANEAPNLAIKSYPTLMWYPK